jgi:PKD repeat protein
VITEWRWDFGYSDYLGIKAESNEQNPQHTFPCWNQTFDITLTVIGPGGSDTEIKEYYVGVHGCG